MQVHRIKSQHDLGASGNTFVLNPSRNVFLTTDGTNWFEVQTQGSDWLTKTGAYTCFWQEIKYLLIHQVAAFTITLPASPSVGDEVRFLRFSKYI